MFGVLALPELVRTFNTTAFTTPRIRLVITGRVCVVTTTEVTIVMSMWIKPPIHGDKKTTYISESRVKEVVLLLPVCF